MRRTWAFVAILLLSSYSCAGRRPPAAADPMRDLQRAAVREGRSDVAHWGPDPERYVSWHHHTNRLVPVYTFGTAGAGPGVDLESYTGSASAYRDADALGRLYGDVSRGNLNPTAEYLDQTDVAALQRAALGVGRRHLFLVVLDGLDWDLTRAAAAWRSRASAYASGRGAGLHFQDYSAAGTTQFGYAVTSPRDARHGGWVDSQAVHDRSGGLFGGYDAEQGGPDPWTPGSDPLYVAAENRGRAVRHAVADSAAAVTALASGVKTFNGAINVDVSGKQLSTVAHEAQAAGYAVGVVTSVPVSHATPAGAYSHNVRRTDYQDLARDLLGLRSVSHPERPLPGVDVLIGCGWGVSAGTDAGQGQNFVPGNRYLTRTDLRKVDKAHGGSYVVATRTGGVAGADRLAAAAAKAAATGGRLLGFYGVAHSGGHLPYRTANGDFAPAPDRGGAAERYGADDLVENPTLAEMTAAALRVLERDPDGFWLMVEAGDVDWAAHDANLDTAIGAVLDGDDAVRVITDWVEAHSSWSQAVLVVTSDHGHYFVLERPAALEEARR